MANPYRSEAVSTGAAKFKGITGRSGGGSAHDGEREGTDSLAKAVKSGKQLPEGGDLKATGNKGPSRLDKYARGGRAKKGNNVTINIVSPRSPSDAAPDIGAGGPLPPVGPPPGAGAGPPGPPITPPGPGPGGLPPMMAGPGPGGPPPMMRKSGGRTNLEDSKEDKMQDKKLAKAKVAKKFYGGPAVGLPPQANVVLPAQAMARPMGPPAGAVPVMRASGGSVGHKYPGMTKGGDSGLGRLEKKNKYGLKPNSKND